MRTVTLGKGKYRRVCFIGGKSYAGHIKTKKKGGSNKYSEGLKKKA